MKQYLDFIHTYPFFGDPIFLLYPNIVPTKDDLLKDGSWKHTIRYPLIDSLQSQTDLIYNKVINFRDSIDISRKDDWIQNQYRKRFSQFENIVWMIENFYQEDEQRKFEIITDYFGVDISYCQDILTTHQKIENFFNTIPSIHALVSERILGAKEIKFYFEKALQFLHINAYWKVEISDTVMAIVHGDFTENGGKIFIPSSRKISVKKLLSLVIHEIDAHARQFTYAGNEVILSAAMRMPYSEEIAEGLAILLEYSLSQYLFGENRHQETWSNFENKMLLYNRKISMRDFLDTYSGNQAFRIFRGFYDINSFLNTKDFLYKQGLFRVLDVFQKYGTSGLDTIYTGLVNEEYIKNNTTSSSKENSIVPIIQQSSAFYLFTSFFYEQK